MSRLKATPNSTAKDSTDEALSLFSIAHSGNHEDNLASSILHSHDKSLHSFPKTTEQCDSERRSKNLQSSVGTSELHLSFGKNSIPNLVFNEKNTSTKTAHFAPFSFYTDGSSTLLEDSEEDFDYNVPFPTDNAGLYTALRTLENAASAMYSAPEHSVTSIYLEAYVTYVLEYTMQTQRNVSQMVFHSIQSRRALEAAYAAWKYVRGTRHPLDESHQTTVQATCRQCSKHAREIIFQPNGLAKFWIYCSRNPLLSGLASGLVLFVAILCIILVHSTRFDPLWAMYIIIGTSLLQNVFNLCVLFTQSRAFERLQLVVRFLNSVCVRAMQSTAIQNGATGMIRPMKPRQRAVSFAGFCPQVFQDEEEPNALESHSHNTDLHPSGGYLLLMFSNRKIISKVFSNEIANVTMIFGCSLPYRMVCFWSRKCEQVIGFSYENVCGNDMFALLADEDSKKKMLPMFSEGAEELYHNTVQVSFLSENFLQVPVRVTRLPCETYTEDAPRMVFFVGVPEYTHDTTKFTTTLEYVTCMAEDAHHTFQLVQECVTNELGTQPLLSSQAQLLKEVNRLLSCLSSEKILNVSTKWSSCLTTFALGELLGTIVESRRVIARERGHVIHVELGPDLPELVNWDPDMLVTTITSIIDCMLLSLKSIEGSSIRVNALRSAVFHRDFMRLHVTCDALGITQGVLCTLFEQRCVSFVEFDEYDEDNVVHPTLEINDFITGAFTTETAAFEGMGGKLTLRAGLQSTDFVLQIPLINNETVSSAPGPGKSVTLIPGLSAPRNSLSTGSLQSNNMSSSTEKLKSVIEKTSVPSISLNIAIFETSEVFLLGIAHYFFSRSHTVFSCRSVVDLHHTLERHQIHAVVYDIESTLGQTFRCDTQQKCQDTNTLFIPSTFSSWNKSSQTIVKPIVEANMNAILSCVLESAQETMQREEQIKKIRSLFTEYKSGDWVRGELIGSGSFGEVYIATNILTSGRMAVKILPLDTEDEEIKTRTEELLNEIDILATMEHPNVIHYFYCERGKDSVNIFMEYANRGSLSSLIAERELSVPVICRILREVISAVVYIHELEIVHRDIKAANILLSGNVAKLSDFGTASRLRNGFVSGTKGTIRFMAPEVMRSEAYGCSCDIWSIGCLLIELITREQPWKHISADNNLIVFTKLSDLSLDTEVDYNLPEAPPLVKSFLDACLQVNPKMRSTARTLLTHPLLNKTTNDFTHSVSRRASLVAREFDPRPLFSETSSIYSTRSRASIVSLDPRRNLPTPSYSTNNTPSTADFQPVHR